MSGLINNAIVNYKAIIYKLIGRQEMKYVAWPQLLKDTNIIARIAYDVFAQRNCQRLISRSDYDDNISKVSIGQYTLYYPQGADFNILARTYYEIFNPHCGHFYDVEQTCPQENDIVLDIGACEGLYGLKNLASLKKIYLFEPSRLMCQCLSLSFRDSDASRYEIMNLILADRAGEEIFFSEDEKDPTMSEIVSQGERFTYKLRSETVDSLLESRRIDIPTLIKMDVQGAELKILTGAAATIREHKPRMAITTSHYPLDGTEIIDYCKGLRPDYRFILKGITTTEPIPRPTMVHFF